MPNTAQISALCPSMHTVRCLEGALNTFLVGLGYDDTAIGPALAARALCVLTQTDLRLLECADLAYNTWNCSHRC